MGRGVYHYTHPSQPIRHAQRGLMEKEFAHLPGFYTLVVYAHAGVAAQSRRAAGGHCEKLHVFIILKDC